MDILHLVDRLEELFNDSRPIPFTNNVIVDEDRMLDLIDQMRVAIPDQVKQAQKVVTDKDRIQAQAHEEAQRTIQLAREKSEGLVDRDTIVEAAQGRAQKVIEQALLDAEATRTQADDYVLDSLTAFEIEMERIIQEVRNGIRAIHHTNPDAKTPTEQ